MKFSEDILRNFDLQPEEDRIPVNVMQVRDMLLFLKECADRIVKKCRMYCGTDDADLQLDCIDIVTVKLNDFTQVFKDLIIFMRKQELTYNGSTSLRYCISSYDSFEFCKTEAEEAFLKELLIRNEIIHDYFNRELHQQKLIWIIEHCSEGALDVYNHLQCYCAEHSLLDKYANQNQK